MTKIILLGGAGILIAYHWAGLAGLRSAPPQETQPTEQECRANSACFGNRYLERASADCRTPIERLAKYDFEWTDGVLHPAFTRAAWKDQKKGTLTFIGGEMKVQNGFGAWQRVIYRCDYDPADDKVLGVRIEPGKL